MQKQSLIILLSEELPQQLGANPQTSCWGVGVPSTGRSPAKRAVQAPLCCSVWQGGSREENKEPQSRHRSFLGRMQLHGWERKGSHSSQWEQDSQCVRTTQHQLSSVFCHHSSHRLLRLHPSSGWKQGVQPQPCLSDPVLKATLILAHRYCLSPPAPVPLCVPRVQSVQDSFINAINFINFHSVHRVPDPSLCTRA